MDRRKDGGGRERVEKRIREKRESVFISRGYQERKKEGLHAKLRKRMGLSDGLARDTIAILPSCVAK